MKDEIIITEDMERHFDVMMREVVRYIQSGNDMFSVKSGPWTIEFDATEHS